MLQLFSLAWMRPSGPLGISLLLHWPTNQLAFGYVAGSELSIGSIHSFTGHILLGIFEVRLAKVSIDRDSANLARDLDKLVDRLNQKD